MVGGDYTNGAESGIADRGSERFIDGKFHWKVTAQTGMHPGRTVLSILLR